MARKTEADLKKAMCDLPEVFHVTDGSGGYAEPFDIVEAYFVAEMDSMKTPHAMIVTADIDGVEYPIVFCYRGTTYEVAGIDCPLCDGSGLADDCPDADDCAMCDGSGVITGSEISNYAIAQNRKSHNV